MLGECRNERRIRRIAPDSRNQRDEIRSTGEALGIIASSTRQITVDLRRGGQTILLNDLIQ